MLGVVLAVFMVMKAKQQETANTKTLAKPVQISPTVPIASTKALNLEISEPENNTVFKEDKIHIKGKTVENSLLVIQSSAAESITKTANGDFDVEWGLSYGENYIRLTVYPADKQLRQQEKTLRVFYLNQ